ncbi:MAG: N-6 DNA methylase, partial [Clostridioides difficile]|nr:N-6 DNA methylase [Clostridioides difficile]
IVILKKQGLSELERYDTGKMIESSKNLVRLNVADRDDVEKLPGLEELIDKIKRAQTYQYNFDNLEAVTQESFKTMMEYVKRARDKIQYPNVKPLLVEILKLKVFDERNIKDNNEISSFFITDKEIRENGYGTPKFRKRVFELYEGAREIYDNLGTRYLVDTDTEELSPINPEDEKMMIEIFKVLQGKGLTKGDNNNFNQTIFNNFGDEVEKSVAGQFFTPIPIIKAICTIVNQGDNEELIDPSCGICDFPTISYKVSDNKVSANKYYGVDISTPVLNLAELNLILNGLGSINLDRKNSLYEKRCSDGTFTDINNFTPDNYDIKTWKHKDDKRKNIKQYTIGTTNPPFGKGRDLKTGKDGIWDYGLTEDNMKMYETWSLLGNPKSIDMGILFLENIYKITKPGGRFAIVLSNSIASIDSWAKVRLWLIERVRLVALIDLPQNSFGETGVATTVIVAYKPKENEKKSLLSEDYEVFSREIKYTGYEVQTVQRNIVFEPIKEYNPITFEDTGNLKEDFSEMLIDFNEYMKYQNGIIKKAFRR